MAAKRKATRKGKAEGGNLKPEKKTVKKKAPAKPVEKIEQKEAKETKEEEHAPLKCVPEAQTLCPHCKYPTSRIYGTTPDPTAGKMRRYRECQRERCKANPDHFGRFVSVRDMTETERVRYGFPVGA